MITIYEVLTGPGGRDNIISISRDEALRLLEGNVRDPAHSLATAPDWAQIDLRDGRTLRKRAEKARHA